MHVVSWETDTEKRRQRHSDKHSVGTLKFLPDSRQELLTPCQAWLLLPRLNFVYRWVYGNFGYMHFRDYEFSGLWTFEDMNFRDYKLSGLWIFGVKLPYLSIKGVQIKFFFLNLKRRRDSCFYLYENVLYTTMWRNCFKSVTGYLAKN